MVHKLNWIKKFLIVSLLKVQILYYTFCVFVFVLVLSFQAVPCSSYSIDLREENENKKSFQWLKNLCQTHEYTINERTEKEKNPHYMHTHTHTPKSEYAREFYSWALNDQRIKIHYFVLMNVYSTFQVKTLNNTLAHNIINFAAFKRKIKWEDKALVSIHNEI